jgi:hypothetical protein
MKQILLLSLLLCLSSVAKGQDNPDDKRQVIQFSGVVVTQDEFGEMIPLPYTSIGIKNSARGTYSEIDGFFSLVAEVGDTLIFSRIGFKTSEHTVSDSLESKFYSWYQVMSKDNILLPEAVIYPWPDRDHYKIEFLALDVSNELRERAEANLAAEVLERMKYEVALDGENAHEIEQAKQQYEYQYSGQFKPQKIFDVVAWSQFIQAWKRGDFKRKKKKK